MFKRILSLILASLMLVACGNATNTSVATISGNSNAANLVKAPTLTKLTLALDWVPNTNHTGIYVAMQQGWYKDANIDLQILPYSDGVQAETLVGEGKADLGISATEGVVTARGAGLPIVSVAAIIQHNTSGFAVLKDSSIKRPKDFAGKKYAGFGAAYEEPVIAKVIRADGGTDTKIQNITANVSGYQAVANKQADFVWLFAGWDGIQAKRDKVDLNIFYLKDIGIPDYYTPVIIANSDNFNSKREALRAFMAATARGYDFAIANPKDAANLLIAANPKGTFSDADLVYESQQFLSGKYKDDAAKWGLQTLAAWTDYPKLLVQAGVVTGMDGKPITIELDYKSLFTNDLLN